MKKELNMRKSIVVACALLAISTESIFAVNIGTVNGIDVTQKEANNALKVLTKGQKTWDALSKDEKVQLMNMIAPSKLVLTAANKELSAKEKESALSAFWMQRSMSQMNISDEQAKKAYDKLKKSAKDKKKIPSFEQAKKSLKVQLAQEAVVKNLMKQATIKVK